MYKHPITKANVGCGVGLYRQKTSCDRVENRTVSKDETHVAVTACIQNDGATTWRHTLTNERITLLVSHDICRDSQNLYHCRMEGVHQGRTSLRHRLSLLTIFVAEWYYAGPQRVFKALTERVLL